MMGPTEKNLVKNLLTATGWPIVEQVINEMIAEIHQRRKSSDTEWETIKNTLIAEGEAIGITNLVQRLYAIAKESK